MKYFIVGVVLFLLGCTPKVEPVDPPFLCIHPAIQGGTPFQLPTDAYFTNRGVVSFTAPDGAKIDLAGIVCIRVRN